MARKITVKLPGNEAMKTIRAGISAVSKTGNKRALNRTVKRATKAVTQLEGGKQLQRQKTLRYLGAEGIGAATANAAARRASEARDRKSMDAAKSALNSLLTDMYGGSGKSQDGSTTNITSTEGVGRP